MDVLISLMMFPTFIAALLLISLGLEEKVGQMLMAHFRGTEEAKKLIEEIGVGGVIYYNWSNDLSSPEKVKALSQEVQQMAKIPLLIAVDQEGGIVTRLKEGFTPFPGARILGLTEDVELAKSVAFAMGQEMSAVGVNLNLAPVVDVAWTTKSPLLQRSFGNSVEKVVAFGQQVLEGYRQASVFSCLKHFPGHGAVESDSHFTLPVLNKTKEELLKSDLAPFARLGKCADCIMTAHIMVPSIDPHKNGTLSAPMMGILREEIGFDGVVISDSLVMKGVLEQADSVLDAAIQSIVAGVDIVLLGGKQLQAEGEFELSAEDVGAIHQGIVAAVKNGLIPEERINQSVDRILALKSCYTPSTTSFQTHEAVTDRVIVTLLKNQSAELGDKIWKNECQGTMEGLTHWNKGEAFGSFGIGHFIWYPPEEKGPFDETFPSLVAFLKTEGVEVPEWLLGSCPWTSRDQFLKEFNCEKMVALRQFLLQTKERQALFIAYRLKEAIPLMIEGLSSEEAVKLKGNFYRLLADPQGLYPLVDYLNFKGAGISANETYQGKGWGLKQVLLASNGTLPSFIEAAKKILRERVENAPKDRGEERWLKGWLARIDSYR